MFCQGRFFTELLELAEGSVVGAGEGGVVAVKGHEGVAAETEFVEGGDDAFVGGEVVAVHFIVALREVLDEEAGFDGG